MIKNLFWVLVILNIAIRCIHVDTPFLEGSATRQIYNVMVAKTFFEERLNVLYPKIYINGNNPYYSALEIQIIPFLAALYYKCRGAVHDEIFRVISIFFLTLSLIVLFKWVSSIFNEGIAFIASFFFGFSPINIYLGRSANYEMAMMFFVLLTFYLMHLWILRERWYYGCCSAMAFVFAVSLKIPNLYLLLPISWMLFSAWGWKAFKRGWGFYMALIVIVGIQGWLRFLRILGPHEHWVHFDLHYNVMSIIQTLSSIEFYKKFYADALHYILTPLGLFFMIVGLLMKKNKQDFFLLIWLGSVGIFYLLIPETVGVHSYYHIHYIPIAAIFIAKGFDGLSPLVDKFPLSISMRKWVIAHAVIFLVMAARFSISFYAVPENKRAVVQSGKIVQQMIPKDALIVASVDSPVSLLYYADRRGWSYDFSEKTKDSASVLKTFIEKGAQYFASADKKGLQYSNTSFLIHLKSEYTIVYENNDSVIFDLKHNKSTDNM